MADAGILTLAYGGVNYAREAKWLAKSVRYRTSGVPLAVATDLDPALFEDDFDIVIPWRFDRWPGLTSKLELLETSPFTATLFIDSDCLCVRSVAPVFDYFEGNDFAVYGSNSPDLPWGDGSGRYRKLVDAVSYPVFNGGLYFFRKSPLAREVFDRAKAFSVEYESLGFRRSRSNMNEEPLISLAMASLGLRATAKADIVVMIAPEAPRFHIDIDLLRGHCSLVRRGRRLEPQIVHFAGPRRQIAAYRREAMVLDLIVNGNWPRATRPIIAIWAAAKANARLVTRRLTRLLRSRSVRPEVEGNANPLSARRVWKGPVVGMRRK